MSFWRGRADVLRGARSTRRSAPGPSRATTSVHRAAPDFTGVVSASYAPDLDGRPDPGEVVWTWVPFEEDPSQGKDRPVLLVGRDGPWLLALMLTSKDHTRVSDDRRWLDIGAGPWDPNRRPSEVRLDRVLRVDPAVVRREGAALPRSTFDQVTRAMTALRG